MINGDVICKNIYQSSQIELAHQPVAAILPGYFVYLLSTKSLLLHLRQHPFGTHIWYIYSAGITGLVGLRRYCCVSAIITTTFKSGNLAHSAAFSIVKLSLISILGIGCVVFMCTPAGQAMRHRLRTEGRKKGISTTWTCIVSSCLMVRYLLLSVYLQSLWL